MPVSLTAADVIGFDCNLSLLHAPTATAILDNDNDQLSPHTNDIRGHVLSLTVTRDATPYTLFKGRIRSVRPTYAVDGRKIVEATLSSVTEPLTKRAVTTESFANEPATDLLEYLLDKYGGLDIANYAATPFADGGEIMTLTTVAGSSLIAEFRKIANACNVEIFVGPDGKITTEAKRTAAEAADHTMEKEDLQGEVTEDRSEIDLASVCRVRGRFVTLQNEEEAIVQDAQVQAIPENRQKMIVAVEPDHPVTGTQLKDTSVIGLSGASSGKVLGFDDRGNILVELTGSFNVGEVNDVSFRLYGMTEHVEVEGTYTSALAESLGVGAGGALPGPEQARRQVNRRAVRHKVNVDRQVAKQPNEPTEGRVEVVVQHAGTVSAIGVRYMDVDNPYIQDAIMANTIGERALLERRWGQHKFTVKGPWIPEVRTVNKIVSLPLGYESEVAKCLVVGLSVRFSNDPFLLETVYELVKMVA